MPALERSPSPGGPFVQGFSGRGFRIEGKVHEGVLMTPEAVQGWAAPDLSGLAPDDVAPLLTLDPPPEFLLLGTGAAQAFPPRAFLEALEARGIGIEAMDSRAAARTWGVLRGEGRWIVAALMPL